MKQTRPAKSYILPVLAGILSLLTLIDSYVYSNLPKVLVAVLGLVAAVLFFVGNKHFLKAIKAWMIALIPVITWNESPIWDVTPIFGFNFSFGLGLKSGMLDLGVSILPLFLIALYRFLKANSIVGKTVTLSTFRDNNKLAHAFPLNGSISESLKIEGENNWFKVDLESPLNHSGIEYQTVLVRDKDEEVYRKGKSKVSHLRLVENPEALNNQGIKKAEFPFVDWAKVTLNE